MQEKNLFVVPDQLRGSNGSPNTVKPRILGGTARKFSTEVSAGLESSRVSLLAISWRLGIYWTRRLTMVREHLKPVATCLRLQLLTLLVP